MAFDLSTPPPASLDAEVDGFGVTAHVKSRVGTPQALVLVSLAAAGVAGVLALKQLVFAPVVLVLCAIGLWVIRRPCRVVVRPDGIEVNGNWIPSEELADAQVVASKVMAEEQLHPHRFLQITTRRPWRQVHIPANLHTAEDLRWLSAVIRSVAGPGGDIDEERAAQGDLEKQRRRFVREVGKKSE